MSEYIEYGYTCGNMACTNFYLVRPIEGMLSPNVNKCILDVGCGNGWLTSYLYSKGYNIYGIDASEKGISIAQKNLKDRFFIHDINGGDLPFELKQLDFDTILSTEVVEHLYDPRKYIKFCKNILLKNKEMGELIISTPYHGYLKNLILAISGKLDGHFTALWDGGHIKFWSRQTLTCLLNEENFKISQFVGTGRVPFLWKSMIIKSIITKNE